MTGDESDPPAEDDRRTEPDPESSPGSVSSPDPGQDPDSGPEPGSEAEPGSDPDPGGVSGSRVAGADPDEWSLEELRGEIADVDRELVELIARRTYVAGTIAEVKDERGMATTDERQERRVLERAAGNAERFDLDPDRVREVFRSLIELNKAEQRNRR